MNTRLELEDELRSQLQVSANSTLYPAERITKLIQNAYIWATELYIWRDLVDALLTGTIANREYYDYPSMFRSGTVVLLYVDNKIYIKKDFKDFKIDQTDNPTSTERHFTEFGRKLFLKPIPTVNGVNNIELYGAKVAAPLTSSSDQTIFSGNKASGNECVVLKAHSVAIKKDNAELAVKEEKDAIAILGKLHKDEWEQTQNEQKMQPMFEVPNFFAPNTYSPINNFSYGR